MNIKFPVLIGVIIISILGMSGTVAANPEPVDKCADAPLLDEGVQWDIDA